MPIRKQQTSGSKAFRRRRRLSVQIGRIRDRFEEKMRREVLAVYRVTIPEVMRRFNKGERDPRLLLPATDWNRRFNRKMIPSTTATIFGGVLFEETWIGIRADDDDQSIGRGGYSGAVTATQAPGDIPDAPDIKAPPSIDVSPSAQMQTSIRGQLQQRSVGVWQRIPESIQTRLGRGITRGLADGDTLDDLSARISKILKSDARGRSRVIARTECLSGDAVVTGARPSAVYRRWYHGPFVEVVTNTGRKFRGTANHPVLTLRGWVGLGDVTKADYLICNAADPQQCGSTGNENINRPPSTIREIFESLSTVGFAERERTRKPDFHGDGGDGDVDIFRADGKLTYGRFTPVTQCTINRRLEPADLATVVLACDGVSFRAGRPVHDRDRFLWCSRPLSSVTQHSLNCGLSHAVFGSDLDQAHSGFVLADDFIGWQVDPSIVISAVHQDSPRLFQRPHCPGTADAFVDSVHRTADPLSDSRGAQPGSVQPENVVDLRVSEFNGHVYNLTTRDGYFLCGGVYTGNTTNAMNFGQQIEREELEIDEKEWVSRLDNRNRGFDPKSAFDHVRPDGQVVSNGSAFMVSGELLRWPGDSSGSAGNVIQCRCASVAHFRD